MTRLHLTRSPRAGRPGRRGLWRARDAKLVPPPPVSPSIAIVGATLWDGTGRAPVTNAVTVIRGDRILCAGAAGECPVPRGARVIDGPRPVPHPRPDRQPRPPALPHGREAPAKSSAWTCATCWPRASPRCATWATIPPSCSPACPASRPRPGSMRCSWWPAAGSSSTASGRSQTDRGVVYRQAPAMTMQALGWTPIQYNRGDDPEAVVAAAREAGAMGLKLYAQLDSVSVRLLTAAAHRAGMPVWGHAWVQPASVRRAERRRHGRRGPRRRAGR